MKFRFSIGRRISFGFSIIILSTIVAFIINISTLNTSREKNDEVTNVYTPSQASLNRFKLLIVESEKLIDNWVNLETPPDNKDKIRLDSLTTHDYPSLRDSITRLSSSWEGNEKDSLKAIFASSDSLFFLHDMVRTGLNSMDSYSSLEYLEFVNMVQEGGAIYVMTSTIIDQLDNLIQEQKEKADKVTVEMLDSFGFLEMLMISLGIGLVLAAILIGYFTTRSIVQPVKGLKYVLLGLSKGIFPKNWISESNDEIGEMANALNKVVAGLKQTKDFANDVGSGKYDTPFEPLSKEDELGNALLTMRKDLAENERVLEQKVIERTAEVVRQKEEIELQSLKIGELYNQVTDSIIYAKRIQEAILPAPSQLTQNLPEHFILYKPKDIVSGDFYWMETLGEKTMVAAADCTGHGVPGAFMSIVGNNLLNRAVREAGLTEPALILDNVNKSLSETLNHDPESKVRDGMDLALVTLERGASSLQYAGAYNSLYLVRDGELLEFKSNKIPIGGYFENQEARYTNNVIETQPGDAVYIFSDGYADQFGGPKGKKLKYGAFKNMLIDIQKMSMAEQNQFLDQTIEEWRGDLEQVDDILVIGFQF